VEQGINVAGGRLAGDEEGGEFDILLVTSKNTRRKDCFGERDVVGERVPDYEYVREVRVSPQ
jgi:hypothetical protein